MSSQLNSAPPDRAERRRALDPGRSVLVQAPAGSGKTDLLTRRFLRLLAEVEEPGQVLAITFTNAAAAEMRHRILAELEAAATCAERDADDPFSMATLARRALDRSQALGWNLLDLPSQLSISTIDSFCRDLALQQPLLSGLGGGLDIAELPSELYRRAARHTLERIGKDDPALSQAIEDLLLWRDNGWQEMEELLVEMLSQRDRWMHGFVLDRALDLDALRDRLEKPFGNAVGDALIGLEHQFIQVPQAIGELLALARFACTQTGGQLHRELAELAEFPCGPFQSSAALEEARTAWLGVAALLLTGGGAFRKSVDKRLGFPADRKPEKARLLSLIDTLRSISGLEFQLANTANLPPARYTEDDWQIVRACFTLLRRASAELRVVFAEAGKVDFIEVAQIAQGVLKGPDDLPTDAAMAVSDRIRHLLVDEFQDTSRRQHEMLKRLIAAWPERLGRTCFLVGDPMQSIYFFRDADPELFDRVRDLGLETPNDEPLLYDFVPLKANFRTEPPLVTRINEIFDQVFATSDGSGIPFSAAEPQRDDNSRGVSTFKLHLKFVPQPARGKAASAETALERGLARTAQANEIVALIRSHLHRMQQARARGEKYRIAVLGRARTALAPIAQALHDAEIPFRAIDLEKLAARPEVLDALALARALLNPMDRVAWLGVLRAPWSGLSLQDLHVLTSDDDPVLLARAVPELLAERLSLLSEEGRHASRRVLEALDSVPALRAAQPTASLGSWLEQVWLALGGADCVDRTARANLDLLWSCLDRLPGGEQDLLGPALNAALDKLTAEPDPEADSNVGVQLMTIHKSKGLEFEVVIVPDLQAAGSAGSRKMLSWLERGLPRFDDSGESTEFLIAPLQRKGDERGTTKQWVDRIYRERESQEMRRILYVAATRAREELHFFARPGYKTEADGSLSLPTPSNSLLATAWPALEEEVRACFEEWKTSDAGQEQVLDSIAASVQSNVLAMPAPAKPTLLRRLPSNYHTAQSNRNSPLLAGPGPLALSQSCHPEPSAAEAMDLHLPFVETQSLRSPGAPEPVLSLSRNLASETWESRFYDRHEGGALSRALGAAVHSFLEQLSRLRNPHDWQSVREELSRLQPRIVAQIRAVGIDPAQSAQIASQALEQALNAANDPIGKWILSPHANADSEVSWTGVVRGRLRTVRVDRVFRAGNMPLSDGEKCWWVVDYKTAHADDPNLDPAAELAKLRPVFAPQLEAYADLLRKLHGADAPIHAGLYYPRMLLFDWWEA